jgi:acylphosphatase
MTDQNWTIRHVVVHGRVHGVGFRAWTERVALTRGLEGWVRNRREGTVEAVFAGPADAVAAMIEACRQGPPMASVEAIDAREAGVADLKLRRPSERFSMIATV